MICKRDDEVSIRELAKIDMLALAVLHVQYVAVSAKLFEDGRGRPWVRQPIRRLDVFWLVLLSFNSSLDFCIAAFYLTLSTTKIVTRMRNLTMMENAERRFQKYKTTCSKKKEGNPLEATPLLHRADIALSEMTLFNPMGRVSTIFQNCRVSCDEEGPCHGYINLCAQNVVKGVVEGLHDLQWAAQLRSLSIIQTCLVALQHLFLGRFRNQLKFLFRGSFHISQSPLSNQMAPHQ